MFVLLDLILVHIEKPYVYSIARAYLSAGRVARVRTWVESS